MRTGLTSFGVALLLLAGCSDAAGGAREIAATHPADGHDVIEKAARDRDPWAAGSWDGDEEESEREEQPSDAEPGSGGASDVSSSTGRRSNGRGSLPIADNVNNGGGKSTSPSPASTPSAGAASTPSAPSAPSASPAKSGSGSEPKVPEIVGSCPTFRSGTATIGGLGGISMQVGEKKNGTGSIVFYWHGTGSSSFESFMFAGTQEVLAQGGIVVAPSGSLRTGGDCSGTATFSKDDMKVMDLIYACAVRDHGIDPRRAYTTGCSAGGLQAGCFASLRSSYIAAAVPNSGGIVFPQQLQDPSHVPALMTMHGGPSDMVVVAFSQTSATLTSQFARAGGEVLNCNHGGGHCGAPATLQTLGWQFMKDHPFGARPYAGQGGTPNGFPSYCRAVTAN